MLRAFFLFVLSMIFGAALCCLFAASPAPKSHTVSMLVTAYCSCKTCCGPKAHGVTASGKTVSYNHGKFCAAPREYSFGTRMNVPGYNNGKSIEVIDRGGAIKTKNGVPHIDLFFPTHQQAREWGSQKVDVTVWD